MAKKIEGIHETPTKDVKVKKTFKKFYFPETGETIEAETMKDATNEALKRAKK